MITVNYYSGSEIIEIAKSWSDFKFVLDIRCGLPSKYTFERWIKKVNFRTKSLGCIYGIDFSWGSDIITVYNSTTGNSDRSSHQIIFSKSGNFEALNKRGINNVNC